MVLHIVKASRKCPCFPLRIRFSHSGCVFFFMQLACFGFLKGWRENLSKMIQKFPRTSRGMYVLGFFSSSKTLGGETGSTSSRAGPGACVAGGCPRPPATQLAQVLWSHHVHCWRSIPEWWCCCRRTRAWGWEGGSPAGERALVLGCLSWGHWELQTCLFRA